MGGLTTISTIAAKKKLGAGASPTAVADLSGKIKTAVGVAGVAGVAILVGRALSKKDPFVEKAFSGDLVFPRDLDKYSISMAFDFMEYERRSIYKQPYMKPAGTIRLPICKGIIDSYKMQWEEKGQDPFVGAAIENLLSAKEDFGQAKQQLIQAAAANNITSAVGGLAGAYATALSAAKDAVGGIGAGAAMQAANTLMESIGVGSINEALQPFGLAQNPFLTVLFKQPSFKRFKFSWRLAARNPDESERIYKIINEFKRHMLPTIANGTGGTMLHYPDMVKIGFFNSDEYLFRFKPCVIENMSVDYAPETVPSFFKGSENVPTEINLSIDLLEIEYWTRDDFNEGIGGNTGGYIPGVF